MSLPPLLSLLREGPEEEGRWDEDLASSDEGWERGGGVLACTRDEEETESKSWREN